MAKLKKTVLSVLYSSRWRNFKKMWNFFYVSSSPWNLYGFLWDLMNIHNLLQGPLMLRDIGLSRKHFFTGTHTEYKLVQIERIFERFPKGGFWKGISPVLWKKSRRRRHDRILKALKPVKLTPLNDWINQEENGHDG